MAMIRPSKMMNDLAEGYPRPRTVDGTNVKECASKEGAFRHFGKIRKQHTEWTNSETGRPVEAPEYARNDYD